MVCPNLKFENLPDDTGILHWQTLMSEGEGEMRSFKALSTGNMLVLVPMGNSNKALLNRNRQNLHVG